MILLFDASAYGHFLSETLFCFGWVILGVLLGEAEDRLVVSVGLETLTSQSGCRSTSIC